jgi:hypothetical protein
MRVLPVLLILLAGCASQAQVRAFGEGGDIRFALDRGGKPIRVRGIDVYEFEGRHRGERVCEVTRASVYTGGMSMQSWIYGKEAGAEYLKPTCDSLTPGRDYGINVFYENCVASTVFRLTGFGTVLDVGPNSASCWM